MLNGSYCGYQDFVANVEDHSVQLVGGAEPLYELRAWGFGGGFCVGRDDARVPGRGSVGTPGLARHPGLFTLISSRVNRKGTMATVVLSDSSRTGDITSRPLALPVNMIARIGFAPWTIVLGTSPSSGKSGHPYR